jgi:hypothetical protein
MNKRVTWIFKFEIKNRKIPGNGTVRKLISLTKALITACNRQNSES